MPATNLPKANMGLIKVCALHLQVWKRKLEAAKQKGDPAEIKRCVPHLIVKCFAWRSELYAYKSVWSCLCTYVCIMYVCMYICMYVCMYICIMYVCMYVYMYICIYVYMYYVLYVLYTVCTYVCMYRYVCMHVHLSRTQTPPSSTLQEERVVWCI